MVRQAERSKEYLEYGNNSNFDGSDGEGKVPPGSS